MACKGPLQYTLTLMPGWWAVRQAVCEELEKAKKSVSECVDVADQLLSSPVCGEVARVSLLKQVRDLEALATDVDDDWTKKQMELDTELTHLEKFYSCYQVRFITARCICTDTLSSMW